MAAPRTIVDGPPDLSEPAWKAEGEHAVTGHGTYRGERKFVKMVCLSRAEVTINGKPKSFSNANRVVEVAMNRHVEKMVESLRTHDDFRADYFLAAEVVVPNSVPEWAQSWIAEYEKHATVDNPQYAFLFMRDVSAGVPLWRWWGSVSRNTFRNRSIVLAQIVTALEALADAGITHNDLHWSNIIVETIDPKDFREIDLGGFMTTPRFRPVLFDWDRAVVKTVNGANGQENATHVDAFDPHYDLIGLYKNLTQNYRPSEQVSWRLLLHPHFEKMFGAFPSLALNHPHHANPCLSDVTESQRVRYAGEYRFQKKPKQPYTQRPVDCKSEWSIVRGWDDSSLEKPSHAEVVRRITAGLLSDDLMPVKTLFDALYVSAALVSPFPERDETEWDVPITSGEPYDDFIAHARERVSRADGFTYKSGSLNILGEFMNRQELLTEVYLYVTQTLGDLLYGGDGDTWEESVLSRIKDVLSASKRDADARVDRFLREVGELGPGETPTVSSHAGGALRDSWTRLVPITEYPSDHWIARTNRLTLALALNDYGLRLDQEDIARIGDVVQYDADAHESLDGATKGEDVAVVFPRVQEWSIDKDFVLPISTRI